MLTNRRGFTLIELLVLIAIIAILAAILFPVFARARAKAYETQCLSNIKNTATGFGVYLADYKGWYPYTQAYANILYPRYISDCTSMMCPKQIDATCANIRNQCYNWNSRYNRSDRPYDNAWGGLAIYTREGTNPGRHHALDTWVEKPSQTVLLTETQTWPNRYPASSYFENINCCGPADGRSGGKGWIVYPHNDGINVAWTDGHAKYIKKGTGLLGCDNDDSGVMGDTHDDCWWDLGPNTKELMERAGAYPWTW